MKKILALVAVAALVAFAAPAFAANPFMDVPMNSWAYDAVSQLASQGVISGYPDGTFKGNQPMTRYEMASIVARALAVVDMDKASKQDVEMLKRLVVEFKDELDALGVQVDELDSRVAVLEENIGGWKIWGQFRMDAKTSDEDNSLFDYYTFEGNNEFDLNRYRMFLSKQINDTTTFTTRIGRSGSTNDIDWERYYIETVLPYDINLTVGKFYMDWEDDAGLYYDEDAWFTDITQEAFQLEKDFGMFGGKFYVAHYEDYDEDYTDTDNHDYFLYGARGEFAVNEQFTFALSAMMASYDDLDDSDWAVYWADFNFAVNPDVAIRGAYFVEDLDDGATLDASNVDDPAAYKLIVDVDQDAIGFTSFWIEYAMLEEGFYSRAGDGLGGGNVVEWNQFGADLMENRTGANDTTVLFANLGQQWNDKWSTFLQYFNADFDTTGVDDTTEYVFGVKYQLNPAMSFELSYADLDYGDASGTATQTQEGDDSQIRLRTFVSF